MKKTHRLFGLFLLVLMLNACGEEAAGADARLSDAQWVVVDMKGFPDDNIVTGSFSFRSSVFHYDDGTNRGNIPIEWTDAGFNVTGERTTSQVGPGGPGQSYLSTLVEPGTSVVVDITNRRLTLTNGDLVVTAKSD